jgi:transposase
MLASQGISLDRSTLAFWMGRVAWWLKPLHELLIETMLGYPKLFADETPLPMLDPGRGKTKKCQLWAIATDDRPWGGPAPPAIAYVFAEDRKGERAKELLQGFFGILQVDGYAGYNGLVDPIRDGGAVTIAFCSAHARRKFYDVHVATKSPPPKPCAALAHSTKSKTASAVNRQASVSLPGRPRRSHRILDVAEPLRKLGLIF